MESEAEGQVTLHGRLDAFGFEPSAATIEATARPASWRATRALIAAGLGLGAAPVVALVPPHIPWLIGSLAAGGVIARKRLTERYTLRSMTAVCPRCGKPVQTEKGRLTAERTVRCNACGQDLTLTVDLPG